MNNEPEYLVKINETQERNGGKGTTDISELTMVLNSSTPSLNDDSRTLKIHALRTFFFVKLKGVDSSTQNHKYNKELNPPELLDHILITTLLKFQGYIFLEMVNKYDTPEEAHKPVVLNLIKRMYYVLLCCLKDEVLSKVFNDKIKEVFTPKQIIEAGDDLLMIFASRLVQDGIMDKLRKEYAKQNAEVSTDEIPEINKEVITQFKEGARVISEEFAAEVARIGSTELLKQISLGENDIFERTIRNLLRIFVVLDPKDQHAIVVNMGESFKNKRNLPPKEIMTHLARIIAKRYGIDISEQEA